MKVSFNKKVRELREKVNKQVIEMAKIGNNRTTLLLDTYKYNLDMANAVIAKFKAKGFTAELTENLVDDALFAYEKYKSNCNLDNYRVGYVYNYYIDKKTNSAKPMMSYEEFEVWYRKKTDRPKKYVISIEW